MRYCQLTQKTVHQRDAGAGADRLVIQNGGAPIAPTLDGSLDVYTLGGSDGDRSIMVSEGTDVTFIA
ncbi:hypothetical protein GVX82_03735 [Patescibacteria group bacterium]|jgi:hypothetical protein|nr:hypothetical protein [Patescibacteria group bacterium]